MPAAVQHMASLVFTPHSTYTILQQAQAYHLQLFFSIHDSFLLCFLSTFCPKWILDLGLPPWLEMLTFVVSLLTTNSKDYESPDPYVHLHTMKTSPVEACIPTTWMPATLAHTDACNSHLYRCPYYCYHGCLQFSLMWMPISLLS